MEMPMREHELKKPSIIANMRDRIWSVLEHNQITRETHQAFVGILQSVSKKTDATSSGVLKLRLDTRINAIAKDLTISTLAADLVGAVASFGGGVMLALSTGISKSEKDLSSRFPNVARYILAPEKPKMSKKKIVAGAVLAGTGGAIAFMRPAERIPQIINTIILGNEKSLTTVKK